MVNIKVPLSDIFNQSSGEYVNTYSPFRHDPMPKNLKSLDSTLNENSEDEDQLSPEQKLVKEDLKKVHDDNPLQTLAGRMPPINISFKKLKHELEQDKKKFMEFILRISLQQIQNRITFLQNVLKDFRNELLKLQESILDTIQFNNELSESALNAIKNKEFARDENGLFKHESLKELSMSYIHRYDIAPEQAKNFSIEQMLAMVEEEREFRMAQNINLSAQLDQVSGMICKVDDIDRVLERAENILNSNLPEEVKKSRIQKMITNINIKDIESRVEDIKKSTYIIFQPEHSFEFTDEIIDENDFAQKLKEKTPDPLFTKI